MTGIQGKRIALIGGAGFIGHHLALSLKAQGAEVEVIDGLQVNNLLSFAASTDRVPDADIYSAMLTERLDILRASGIPLVVQDARDYHALSRLLVHFRPDVIVHLAAVAHAGKANKDPFTTFDHSLRTLENALDIARSMNIERFIYFSSSMAYGNFMTERVDEEHPLNSIGIYGALKVAGEKMVIAYQQAFGLPYTIVRPSALYGPRCVSRRVTQVFIENALKGKAIQVAGDGKESLDFTYIDDLVQGVSLVIREPAAKDQVLNLTYGSARTVNDLVTILREKFPDLRVENVPRDQLMPHRGTLSVEKARKLIGYEPVNPLEVGYPKYIDWYLARRSMMRGA